MTVRPAIRLVARLSAIAALGLSLWANGLSLRPSMPMIFTWNAPMRACRLVCILETAVVAIAEHHHHDGDETNDCDWDDICCSGAFSAILPVGLVLAIPNLPRLSLSAGSNTAGRRRRPLAPLEFSSERVTPAAYPPERRRRLSRSFSARVSASVSSGVKRPAAVDVLSLGIEPCSMRQWETPSGRRVRTELPIAGRSTGCAPSRSCPSSSFTPGSSGFPVGSSAWMSFSSSVAT